MQRGILVFFFLNEDLKNMSRFIFVSFYILSVDFTIPVIVLSGGFYDFRYICQLIDIVPVIALYSLYYNIQYIP